MTPDPIGPITSDWLAYTGYRRLAGCSDIWVFGQRLNPATFDPMSFDEAIQDQIEFEAYWMGIFDADPRWPQIMRGLLYGKKA